MIKYVLPNFQDLTNEEKRSLSEIYKNLTPLVQKCLDKHELLIYTVYEASTAKNYSEIYKGFYGEKLMLFLKRHPHPLEIIYLVCNNTMPRLGATCSINEEENTFEVLIMDSLPKYLSHFSIQRPKNFIVPKLLSIKDMSYLQKTNRICPFCRTPLLVIQKPYYSGEYDKKRKCYYYYIYTIVCPNEERCIILDRHWDIKEEAIKYVTEKNN